MNFDKTPPKPLDIFSIEYLDLPEELKEETRDFLEGLWCLVGLEIIEPRKAASKGVSLEGDLRSLFIKLVKKRSPEVI